MREPSELASAIADARQLIADGIVRPEMLAGVIALGDAVLGLSARVDVALGLAPRPAAAPRLRLVASGGRSLNSPTQQITH
ncbi:hypothetical protein GT755_12535 [Herbidospora sp. NEAU-GS84]|uniref:Uncharacterized protein n=1 Tax=Herbidospora solisilvae TaxID=2696284 RepID=A0A7C9MZZ6_9ACTN|nr:hypothetical protein [Herbidospora solisilvae]NAS22510.1 hypothetical protein [Herbidospora solisilvae]